MALINTRIILGYIARRNEREAEIVTGAKWLSIEGDSAEFVEDRRPGGFMGLEKPSRRLV